MFSGSGGWGGQGVCERRFKVFVKIQKKNRGRGGKLKLLWKWKCKKNIGGGGVRSDRGWGGGVEGWGLADREGVGWQQCWG